jgi:hypothetical protein
VRKSDREKHRDKKKQTDRQKMEKFRNTYREKREVGGVGGKTKRNRNKEIKKKTGAHRENEKNL